MNARCIQAGSAIGPRAILPNFLLYSILYMLYKFDNYCK